MLRLFVSSANTCRTVFILSSREPLFAPLNISITSNSNANVFRLTPLRLRHNLINRITSVTPLSLSGAGGRHGSPLLRSCLAQANYAARQGRRQASPPGPPLCSLTYSILLVSNIVLLSLTKGG